MALLSWKESFCPNDFNEAFSFFKRYTEGAVLLQTQGREAAITFGKSATGEGRVITVRRSGVSARTRERSDWQRQMAEALRKMATAIF